MNGIKTTWRLIATGPDFKAIGLSAFSDQRYVLEMLDARFSIVLPQNVACLCREICAHFKNLSGYAKPRTKCRYIFAAPAIMARSALATFICVSGEPSVRIIATAISTTYSMDCSVSLPSDS